MKKPESVNQWMAASDAVFMKTVEGIIKGCTGNPNFEQTEPPIEEIKALYEAFKQTVLPRDKMNSETSQIRKKAKEPLVVKLRLLGVWLTAAAKGNLQFMLSTNFPLADEPTPAPAPSTPKNIGLYVTGNNNSLMVTCDAQPNAELYTVRVGRDKTIWLWQESSRGANVLFEGLPTGEQLYLQMRMKNVNGSSEWSEYVLFRIPPTGEVVPTFRKKRSRAVA